MKKLTVFWVTSVFASMCMAHEELDYYVVENCLLFARAIKIDTPNGNLSLNTIPFFQESSVVTTNEYKFIKTAEKTWENSEAIGFQVIYKDKEVATGFLYEATTRRNARNAVLFPMINNNMGWEQIAPRIITTNKVGDFCILDYLPTPNPDKPIQKEYAYFVRGVKAVWLYGNDWEAVIPIAQTLDNLLRQGVPSKDDRH
ncbi:MAG: hypothetical protein FWH21_00310 [Kiritimatiellaeota bacterium]|nr:hypothetical protein [Kiritimatiellota bacterium]